MNLIALETLTAYINLELQALQVLAIYQYRVRGFKTYIPLLKKINKALEFISISFFHLFLDDLECFDDVQSIDLELPIARVFILAYVVCDYETPYYQEFASLSQAIKHCDSKGYGFKVICKYCDPSQNCETVFDDMVYQCKILPCIISFKYDGSTGSEPQNYEIAITNTVPSISVIKTLIALGKQFIQELGYKVHDSFSIVSHIKDDRWYIDDLDIFTFDRMIKI